jgi:S-adenosylmethionine/arginine decarboxylase-like enzyme
MNNRFAPGEEIWGLEASLDLHGCNGKIDNADAVKIYVVELCELIKMKRYGPCLIERFGAPGTDLEGLSMFQFIETSCISGHFSPSTKSAYINVFSCADFDPEVVRKFSEKYFGAHDTKMLVNPRK